MSNNVVVCTDSFLSGLLDEENLSDRDEVRLSVCQIMKRLDLVTLDVRTRSEVPGALDFHYAHTDLLVHLMMDNDSEEEDDEEDDDDNHDEVTTADLHGVGERKAKDETAKQ